MVHMNGHKMAQQKKDSVLRRNTLGHQASGPAPGFFQSSVRLKGRAPMAEPEGLFLSSTGYEGLHAASAQQLSDITHSSPSTNVETVPFSVPPTYLLPSNQRITAWLRTAFCLVTRDPHIDH
ncbi:hypothetical protein CEXT_595081 [Caerostris extrusa]|uniref:Uncharacterized protein n=1 Tax=Caerostris extrusa TaxID=172846 RepID=A0AAV4PJ28_CAEEX|nr:hypothetical protein CEXT_595081 [Caerostris extrusa]